MRVGTENVIQISGAFGRKSHLVAIAVAALNEFRNLFNNQDQEFMDVIALIKPLVAEHESKDNEFKKAA